MRTSVLVAIASLLVLMPSLVSAGYGGVFQGTGWKLLRVDSDDGVRIEFRFPRGEGYVAGLTAVYSDDGTYLHGHPGTLPDVGPGVYVDAAPLPTVAVGPNPPYTSIYGGSGVGVPPGPHYVVVGVAGEISHWTLDAPHATLLDEGPMHHAFVGDLEEGVGVEANAWFVSASVAEGRRLTFEVEGTLLGSFGLGARPFVDALWPTVYESGNATLTFPDGTRMDCFCAYHWSQFPRMPGTYVYEDDRTMLTQYRYPVAVWADVPLPFV